MPALVNALKRVDLPTLGRPTMPHCKLMGFLWDQPAILAGRPSGEPAGLFEAVIAADRLADLEHPLGALGTAFDHDAVHAEGHGAVDAGVPAVGAQRVADL